MNAQQAAAAAAELAASPAAKWIGNRVLPGDVLLQKCMRCGAEETIVLPPHIRTPADVPVGFDEVLFDWKRSFQRAHEGCVESPPSAASEPLEAASAQDASASASAAGAASTGSGVGPGVKLVLRCARHGVRRWQGHIMCAACGQTYQTSGADPARETPRAPETCRCGRRLLPPDVDPAAASGTLADFTARSICYLCYRYFAKHHGGRVPVERVDN